MIGSRGFDFEAEFNPHGGKNMKCDCEFVPGFKGETKIEGYDTKSIYEQWQTSKEIRSELKLTEDEIKTAFEVISIKTISDIDAELLVYEWLEASEMLGEGATLTDIAKEVAKRKSAFIRKRK